MFDENDIIHNPEKAVFEFQKREHAFFDQNLMTGLADTFIERWPNWRYRYLDTEHDAVHIEYIFKVIGDNHPCNALPKIYHYLYTCQGKDTKLSRLDEIAGEAEEYLHRLEEYDQKYAVESWDINDLELANRFHSAKTDAKEAVSVCYREIGHCFARENDTSKTIEFYQKAVDAYYDDEALYLLLKHLTDTGEFEEAKRYCSGLMYDFMETVDPQFKKIRSLVHYNLREYNDCIEVLHEILDIEESEELKNFLEHVVEEQKNSSGKGSVRYFNIFS